MCTTVEHLSKGLVETWHIAFPTFPRAAQAAEAEHEAEYAEIRAEQRRERKEALAKVAESGTIQLAGTAALHLQCWLFKFVCTSVS